MGVWAILWSKKYAKAFLECMWTHMLCHHGAEYQCRLGQRWPLRLTQCHRWCDNIPILRRLQSQWVGSVINKRSWWLSVSLCFINSQANKNILTWSGKINWLGQVHSEFHANKCGFLVLGEYQMKDYSRAWHFAFIKLCVLAIIYLECPITLSWANPPTGLSYWRSLKMVENHGLWDTCLLLQFSRENSRVSLEGDQAPQNQAEFINKKLKN